MLALNHSKSHRRAVARAIAPARRFAAALSFAAALAAGGSAAAQSGPTPFGGFKHDANQPIEVSADELEVRNSDQVAVFKGAVDVRQGDVRMRSNSLEVFYAQGGGEQQGAIRRLRALGDVFISNGKESAKSATADYNVSSGDILLTGDVVLLQGENVIKGQRLRIDLLTGTAKIEGSTASSGGKRRVEVSLEPSTSQ